MEGKASYSLFAFLQVDYAVGPKEVVARADNSTDAGDREILRILRMRLIDGVMIRTAGINLGYVSCSVRAQVCTVLTSLSTFLAAHSARNF